MNLPTITFLSGEARLCAALSSQLSAKLIDLMEVSFCDPLRNAAFGLFYNCDPAHELTDDAQLLPISTPERPQSLRIFKERLHHHMKKEYGGEILGQLAVRRLKEEQMFFERFIFADASADLAYDVKAVADEFKHENCLIVILEPNTFLFPSGIKTITLDCSNLLNDNDLLNRFESLLTPKPETNHAA